jgi:hypothetical protein
MSENRGSTIFWFVIIFILLVLGFVFLGGKFRVTKPIHDVLFGDKGVNLVVTGSKDEHNIVTPDANNLWCQVQEIMVGDSREDPVRDRIIGWDSIYNCCVREIDGYNCALQRDSVMRYCYTANIGGQISYVMVDGYYAENVNYKDILFNYDKEKIPNKLCDATIYPIKVRGE